MLTFAIIAVTVLVSWLAFERPRLLDRLLLWPPGSGLLACSHEIVYQLAGPLIALLCCLTGYSGQLFVDKMGESTFKIGGWWLPGTFVSQQLLAGNRMELWGTDAVFHQIFSDIVENSCFFGCICSQIDSVYNEEHFVQLESILDASQLDEEFAVCPGKSVVIIGDE